MIAKILRNGDSDASKCIKYIEGGHDHKGDPRDRCINLYGESRMLLAVTKIMTRKWRYLSSTLSFTKEESQRLSDDEILDLSISFAKHLSVGTVLSNIPTVIQLHEHDKAVDVHIVEARYDTSTGKSFEPFVLKRGDLKRLRLWQDLQVMENDKLDDPRNTLRIRLVNTPTRKLPKEKRKAIQSIQKVILAGVRSGHIHNRDDVIKNIEDLGFIIKVKYLDSIVIQLADEALGIKLTGAVYQESFKCIGSIQTTNSAVPRRGDADFEIKYKQFSQELISRDMHRRESYKETRPNSAVYIEENNYSSFINFFQYGENVQCKASGVSSSDAKEQPHIGIAVSKVVGRGSEGESSREKQLGDICIPEKLVNKIADEKNAEVPKEEIIIEPEMKKGNESNDDAGLGFGGSDIPHP